MKTSASIACCLCLLYVAKAQPDVSVIAKPSHTKLNSFYFTNQSPLKPQQLVKLPVGAIRPGGWLLKNIELQRDGLAGQLPEISAISSM